MEKHEIDGAIRSPAHRAHRYLRMGPVPRVQNRSRQAGTRHERHPRGSGPGHDVRTDQAPRQTEHADRLGPGGDSKRNDARPLRNRAGEVARPAAYSGTRKFRGLSVHFDAARIPAARI